MKFIPLSRRAANRVSSRSLTREELKDFDREIQEFLNLELPPPPNEEVEESHTPPPPTKRLKLDNTPEFIPTDIYSFEDSFFPNLDEIPDIEDPTVPINFLISPIDNHSRPLDDPPPADPTKPRTLTYPFNPQIFTLEEIDEYIEEQLLDEEVENILRNAPPPGKFIFR